MRSLSLDGEELSPQIPDTCAGLLQGTSKNCRFPARGSLLVYEESLDKTDFLMGKSSDTTEQESQRHMPWDQDLGTCSNRFALMAGTDLP